MSRRLDFIETKVNMIGGYAIAYCVSLFIFPQVGVQTDPTSAGVITAIMTVVSFIRLYCFRRLFRWLEGTSG